MLRSLAQGLLRPIVNRPKQQHRTYIQALCGPPKYPLTTGELFGLGGGWIFVIMIMPMWGLFSVPGWRDASKPKETEA